MKKIAFIAVLTIVFVGVIAILFNNRSKLQARTGSNIVDSYPVTIEKVSTKEFKNALELIGTIQGANDVAVMSEAQGRVIGVYAKVGDYKSQGSLLIQLDGELKLATFKTAEANYEKVKKDYERFEALYKEKSIAESQFEAARLDLQRAESNYTIAKREYSDTKITAPISGVVSSRLVDEGDYVNKLNVVSNIVDISKLKVKLNVAEKDAFRLKKGDDVVVTTDVYPGVKFDGKIESISDQGDASHTYPVEVLLVNSKSNPLKAGMFGKVLFTSINGGNTIVIPRESLVGSVKDASVFVIENGIAKERKVVIGSTYDTMLQVLSGLNEGEEIVVNGQSNLKDNFKVKVVN
jgi:RND family efflux transporter MFP subunit